MDFAIILRVEMNFHADIKSLLKQTGPNAIYRVSCVSRMIHHPAKARAVTRKLKFGIAPVSFYTLYITSSRGDFTMPLLDIFALNIGAAVAKFLIETYWGKNVATTAAGKAFEVAASQILSRKPKDKNIEDVASQIALRLSELLKAEHISDEDRERLALEIAVTLDEAKITSKLLVECNLDYTKLLPYLEAARPDATKLLSANETAIYNRMLREACEAILNFANELVGFERYFSASVLQSEDQIQNAINKLLTRPSDEAERFEKDYRDLVVKYLDEMDIFGVPRMKRLRHSQSLSVAYLTLSAEWDGQREDSIPWIRLPPDEMRMMKPVEIEEIVAVRSGKKGIEGEVLKRKEHYTGDVDKLLAQPAHLVLCGDAGSGKTTLLRWIAVQCAVQKFTGDLSFLNHLVPFYIRLRDYVGDKLETLKPEEFIEHVAADISGKMPHGWVHEQLENGRALVLIDGVDELPKSQREEMRQRLARWVKTFGLARFIVSSRTYALNQNDFPEWWEWINNENFIQATLQRMDADQMDHFVDHWYGALDASLNDKEKRELKEYPANLKSQLRRTPPLRQLAEPPLLCAMICALHREHHRRLPSRRNDLYKECIEMILSKRDEEREIEHTEEYPDLTLAQKIQLAEDFAERLMLNNLSEDDVVNAEKCFADAFSSLNITEVTAENVRHFFVKRANLLREPVIGQIEFAHRTFEEYLAAQRLMKRNYVGVLVEHALNDQWRETIILAAGTDSHPKEANELLAKILQKGDDETDEKSKRRCYLLAIACLAMMVRVEDADLREKVLERAKMILPPKNNDEAELIAYAGDPIVPFLADDPKRKTIESKLCVDTLALIGTDKAMEAIGGYAARYSSLSASDSDDIHERIARANFQRAIGAMDAIGDYVARYSSLPVFDSADIYEQIARVEFESAIGKAWGSFDHSNYVRIVFTRTTTLRFDHTRLSDMSALKDLPNLRELYLTNTQVSDVSALKDLPNLRELYLTNTQVSDVRALKDLPNLKTLSLDNTPVSDVSALKDLKSLEWLSLAKTPVSDVNALKDLKSLEWLSLDHTNLSDVSALKDLPNLNTLSFNNTLVSDVSALKDLKSLVELRLSNTQVSDVSALKDLPNLKSLRLANTPVSNVSTLKDLRSLEWLSLNNTQVSDVNALKDLRSLEWLSLDNTPVSDISALKDLPNLKTLSLDNTPVSDVSALKDLPNLKTLRLDNTQVSDVSALKDLPNLKTLILDNMPMSDVSALKDLKSLEWLSLDHTNLSDVSALKDLPQLQILNLNNTRVSDVSMLRDLPQLRYLHLNDTLVTDLSMKTLKEVKQDLEIHFSVRKIND